MSRASVAMESAFANLFVQGADPHDESALDGQGLAVRGPLEALDAGLRTYFRCTESRGTAIRRPGRRRRFPR